MSANSAEHSRRAVYAAATKVFDDRNAQKQILDFWESNFSLEAAFHVSDFVAKLKDHVGLSPDQRRTLMVTIFSALSKPESQLDPVPSVYRNTTAAAANDTAIPAEIAPPATTKARRDPANVVFSAVLASTISLAAAKYRNLRGELSGVLDDIMVTDRTHKAVADAITRWSDANFDMDKLPPAKNTETMRVITNLVYAALCDVIGPVATDRALSKAVDDAEEMRESQDFPPSQLL